MSFRSILGSAADLGGALLKTTGPALSGFAAGGPFGAGLAVVGQLAGGAEKRRGKKREAGGASPIHKATAPALAVGAPALLALLLQQFGVDAVSLTDGALAGGLALLSHQVGHGLQGSHVRR